MSFIEEGRKKKVEAGREKKKKQCIEKDINYKSEYDNDIASGFSQNSPNTSSFSFPDNEDSTGDNPTIQSPQRKSSALKYLYKQMKELQNELTDKDVLIESLQLELEAMRDISYLDATSGPIPHNESFERKISELQHNLRTRDAYIEKLSENLQQRAQACDAAAQQEKHRLEEIHNLRQQLKEAFEVIENKFGMSYSDQQEQIFNLQSKVSQMNLHVQDNSALVNDLRQALEKKDNELQKKEKELQENSIQLAILKKATTAEIQELMKDVEKLHQMVISKESELTQTKEQLATLRSQLEEQFGEQMNQMKNELWKSYEEERKRLSQINDDKLCSYLENHDMELATQNINMITELKNFKLACEAQFSSYRECMESLVQRIQEDNKRLEEDYEKQLSKCHEDLDNCRQQVDNYENKVSEEVRKVEEKYLCVYESELSKYKCSFEHKSSSAEEEIEKLTHNLKNLAISEAKKEVELEAYKSELKNSKNEINDLSKVLSKQEEDIIYYKNDLKISKEHVTKLSDRIKQANLNELELLKELHKYQKLVKEYEEKITVFNVSLREDLEHVEIKNVNLLKGYEEEIEKLKYALEEESQKHADELFYYTKELQQQQSQLSCINDLTTLTNNTEQLLVYSEQQTNSLQSAIEYSNRLIKQYDKELSDIRQSYINDVTVYKNEVSSLKENLVKVSTFKQQIIQQMVSHKKDFNDLKNKLCSLISTCQQSVIPYDFNSDTFDMDSDDSRNLEKLQYELDTSKSDLYEFLDFLKTSLKQIEQDHSIHLENLSHENNDLRDQLLILQRAHTLLTENKSLYFDNKPSFVVASCQTDSLEEVFDEKEEDAFNQNSRLSKQNSELIKQNDELSIEKEICEKEINRLLLEKTHLEEERQKLINCIESLTQELTANKDIESVNKPQDINDGSAPLKRLFKGIVTSTPNYVTQPSINNNDLTSTPKRHKSNVEQLEDHLISVDWIEKYSKLEMENHSLVIQVETVETNIKEMEHCVNVAHNEVTLLEIKCKHLEDRIKEMEHHKRLMICLEQENIQYKMRNEYLEKDRDLLKIDLKVLNEQNLYLERKNNENISKLCQHFSNDKINLDIEAMILGLKHKSDEIILLKEKMLLDQESHLCLKDRFEEIVGSLNDALSKFDETKKELETARTELDESYKDRGEIALEKRLLEKELFILKAKLKVMEGRKEKCSISFSLGMRKFIQEVQHDLAELKKQSVQEKALMEQITWEKSVAESGEIKSLEKNHLNLLIENNVLLSKEKEELIQCLQEQQHMLSMFRREKGLSEDFWMNIHDVQTKLVTDLRIHLDQHRQLVEALQSIEKVYDGMASLKEQLTEKVQEKNHLEEKLQEEHTTLQAIMIKVTELEEQLNLKEDTIQVFSKEKDSLIDQLAGTKTKLFETESRKIILERIIQDREIRLKHSELELRAAQLDRSRQMLSLKPITNGINSMDVRSELEQQNIAVRAQLQRLYNIQCQQTSLQYSQNLEAVEQQYQDQVSMLQKMLDEKSSDVNKLLNSRLLNSLDLPSDEVAGCQFQDLVDFKENHRTELEDIKRGLDDKGLRIYFILRDKFQLYAQHQVMFAIAKFKNEHELITESEMKALKSQHKHEFQLLKIKMEVEKETEISKFIQDLEKLYCEEIGALSQLVHLQNRKLNMAHCTESELALNQLLNCLSNEYTNSVNNLQNSWKKNYKQSLETICDNLNKNLAVKVCSVSLDLNTNLTDSEKLDKVEELLCQQELVISKAQVIIGNSVLTCEIKRLSPIIDVTSLLYTYMTQSVEMPFNIITWSYILLPRAASSELQTWIQEQHIKALQEFKLSLEEAHCSVVNTIPVLKKQLEEGHVISEMEKEIEELKTVNEELETKHKSAITLLLKDHDSELSSVRTLLSQLQQRVVSDGEVDVTATHTLRTELELKHSQEMEKLRTYFEQKCADLEKHYSEEIYSQHSRKVSGNSSCSDSEAGIDIYYMGGSGDLNRHTPQLNELTGQAHGDCEKRLAEVKEELGKMRQELEAKYESDVEAVKSEYAIRFEEYVRNNMSTNQNAELQALEMKHTNNLDISCSQAKIEIEKDVNKVREEWETKLETAKKDFKHERELGIHELRCELEEKYSRKLEELHQKFLYINQEQDLELKVAQIKSEVKQDYESEIGKIRDEMEKIERLRKEEEIETIKAELNKQHCNELEKVKIAYEEMVKKEVENSLLKSRNEAKLSQELEEKVQFIKEQIKTDYEKELEKIRTNVESIEAQRRDEEIQHLKQALKEVHSKEIKNIKENYESRMRNEMECLIRGFKLEKENIETKYKHEIKIIQDMLEHTAHDHLLQNNGFETVEQMFEKKMEEQVGKIFELTEEVKQIKEKHKSNVIEINNKWEHKMAEERNACNNEIKLNKDKYEQKLLEEKEKHVNLETAHLEAMCKIEEEVSQKLDEHQIWNQQEQEEELQRRVEEARINILHSLEQQIKALVASGDEGEDKSEWPPELAALEQQFTAKYQRQLAQLIEKHALEIAGIHADYEAKFTSLVKEYSLKQAESMPTLAITTGDDELDKIIIERDNLRKLTIALRHVVSQLANYLLNCEEELNNTLVGELLKLDVETDKMQDNYSSKITVLSDISSDEENGPSSIDRSLTTTTLRPKRVHFAPDVSNIITLLEEDCLLEYVDRNSDISTDFGNKLESCLQRLKLEASALLGLSAIKSKDVPAFEGRRLSSMTRQLIEEKKCKDELNNKLQESQEILVKYEQELTELRTELNEIIDRNAKEKTLSATSETVYAASPVQARIHKITQLQDKARGLLAEKGECPPQWLQLIDELCREGDSLAEEARRDREDLQQQVEAADKQLRSTRAFLEEQAAERELERDEFTKEVARLQELLRERDRDWTTKERFATEAAAWIDGISSNNHNSVETLEQQIKETTELLKLTEEKKDELEIELKAAVDKIWVLRDIISEQEIQVSNKSEREATLEHRLDELETELDIQNQAQQKMLQELEALRESGGDPELLEQVQHLQDQLKKQPNSSLVHQMKSQLREMTKSVDKRTKELEALNIHASAASLSSPSEDISIREQLESWRCDTPEDKAIYGGSPPAPLPLEEVSKLHEKLLKLSRVEETIMKKLRDQHMQMSTLRSHIEDVQAERDVLQQQCDRQLVQIASVTSRLDEMRIRTDREQTTANIQLQDKIRNLESQKTHLSEKISNSTMELTTLKEQLNHAQEVVLSQDAKLRSCLAPKLELIDRLQHDLAVLQEEKQKLENVVEKYRSAHNVSLPALVEILLAEKNADIDRLQERVAQFQENSTEQSEIDSSDVRSGHLNSKGHRVSFASDLTSIHLAEDEKIRSAAPDISLQPNFASLSMGDMGKNELVLREFQQNFSSITEPEVVEENLYPGASDRIAQLETELLKMNSELKAKTERLTECEAQLPLMEQELHKTKEELLSTVTAITEDKKYYQEQLEKLASTQKMLTEKENEVAKLRDVLARKEEDIIKTTADVRALQIILENLQKKLQEAKQYVENESSELAQKEIEQLQKEKLEINEQQVQLKKDLDKTGIEGRRLRKHLENEKKNNSKLKEILRKVENERNLINEEVKQINSNCEGLQSELDSALIRIEEQEVIISDLKKQVEEITIDNNKLVDQCSNLKTELQYISQHHNAELSNLSKKRLDEVAMLKEEIEDLQRSNKNLKENCNALDNKLKQNIFIQELLDNNEDKIKQLEFDIKQLEDANNCLKEEKQIIENRFGLEISELKMLMNELSSNYTSLEKSEKEYEHALNKERELQNMITRKYETLKRECDRQRRARKEMEKKYHVLKQELDKEKKYVAVLEEQISGKGKTLVSNLRITETDIFEIKPDARYTDVLDDLAVKLQRELHLSEQLDKSIMSSYQDGPTSPMGIEASTPLARPVSPEGLYDLDLSAIARPGFRRHDLNVSANNSVRRQLFPADDPNETLESCRPPTRRQLFGSARPRAGAVMRRESRTFREVVVPLPSVVMDRLNREQQIHQMRTPPQELSPPHIRRNLQYSAESSPESSFAGIMGMAGSPISDDDVPHRQPFRELFLPPKWHFQPPRRIIPVAGHGTRPGYPAQPQFIAPESPPQGPKIPIFLDLRPATARASFPDVSVRRRMDRTSVPLKFQQPMHPLMFDQYPDHRLTYGGLSSSAWTPQRRDGSLPANLDQNQIFLPPALNHEVGYYSQPLYPVSGFPERFARPLSLPADRPPPLDVSEVQGPLLFDQIPDRRLTYGGLGSSPLTPQRRDRSLPTHLTLDQKKPPIFDRTVDTRASFPLGPPLMSSTMRRRMDPNVTIHQEPQQLIHTRPLEPLYRTMEVRASPVGRTSPTAGPLPHRSFSDSNITHRGIEDTEAGQRTHLPTAIEHLRRKLAEAETSLQIEQMTVNELRAQIDEETRRYEEELLHAQSLVEEIQALKSYLVELEKKTEALYNALEVEKNRYIYMQKMKDPSPEMLAEREAQMKLVEEEKQKYQNLLAFNQRLLAELNEAQNEVYRLKSSPKVKDAQEKFEILESYQGKIEFEEECARDLLQEAETQRALNEQLNDQLNQEKQNTEAKKQALKSVLVEKAELRAKVDEMVIQLENYAQKQKRMVGQMKVMEDTERNRSKRNISSATRTQLVLEQSLASRSPSPNPTPIAHSSFKNALERENSMLKLQLKQAQLQQEALASDTPLKLKLNEANANIQKLVAEREKLHSQFNHLKEQKDILNNTLASVRGENDELRKQLSGSPKILVSDGHMEDINAKYASERAAWLKEKEALQNALAQATRSSPMSLSEFDADLHHILSRYMRAESYRKSLAWQKQYLLVAIAGYKKEEKDTISGLKKYVRPRHHVEESLFHVNKFKVVALTIIGITRMQYLVEHRQNTRQSTYDIFFKVLSNSKKQLPRKCHLTNQRNSVWQRPEEGSSIRRPLLTPLTPGCMSDYMERFNEMQNRIRLTLASNNT